MSVHDNFASKMITYEIKRQYSFTILTSALTAQQAFDVAQPLALHYDTQARFIQIVSGEDISSQGHSREWTSHFLFPQQQAWIVLDVYFHPKTVTSDNSMVIVDERVIPFPKPHSTLQELLTAGTILPPFVHKQWQRYMEQRPPLPLAFRNSPEAVQILASQGIDFISGDTSMRLGSAIASNREAVWQIWAYDVEYTTPFGKVT